MSSYYCQTLGKGVGTTATGSHSDSHICSRIHSGVSRCGNGEQLTVYQTGRLRCGNASRQSQRVRHAPTVGIECTANGELTHGLIGGNGRWDVGSQVGDIRHYDQGQCHRMRDFLALVTGVIACVDLSDQHVTICTASGKADT